MEEWRSVWREAAKLLPTEGLVALRDALAADDPALEQGGTVFPPAVLDHRDGEVKAACPIGFALWRGGCSTPAAVEEGFAAVVRDVDSATGGIAAIRFFTNVIDEEWSRADMLRELLPEVIMAIEQREGVPT